VERCLSHRPDVVLIDIALTPEEEELLNAAKAKDLPADPMSFSGIRKCLELKSELPEIPVALYTNFDKTELARAAFVAGADQFIIKGMDPDALARIIQGLVRSASRCDPELYDLLKQEIAAHPSPWEKGAIEAGLDAFYRNASSVRRFGLLCAHLCPVLSKMLSNAEKLTADLIAQLIDTHALLSLVDRDLQDHVRHSGNVFWIGYFLLHRITPFAEPEKLQGHASDMYHASSAFTEFEQMNFAWLLASLFHDLGYADEKRKAVDDVLGHLYKDYNSTHTESSANISVGSFEALRKHVTSVLGSSSAPSKALAWAFEHWNHELKFTDGTVHRFRDHGLLGASRLLDHIKEANIRKELRPAYYHAVLAIALHNLAKWHRYEGFDEKIKFQPGTFPVCSLLALCDTLQIWDREDAQELGSANSLKALLERLVHYKDAYIRGSALTKFTVEKPKSASKQYVISATIQYYLKYGEQAKEKCEEHQARISTWISSGSPKKLGDAFDLSDLIHVSLFYRIPTIADELRADFF